ncbi:MAG: hypothetical protein JSV39_02235, partial [Candidatus Aenigmatarchaeota archaeon]
MSTEKQVARVNWPGKEGKYKVVQVYIGDKPFMIFPPTSEPVRGHGFILRDFLNSLDIGYEKWGSHDLPVPEGNGYRAVGMGKSEVSPDENKSVFFGTSSTYL